MYPLIFYFHLLNFHFPKFSFQICFAIFIASSLLIVPSLLHLLWNVQTSHRLAIQCHWHSLHWEVGPVFPPFEFGRGLVTAPTNRTVGKETLCDVRGWVTKKACSFGLVLPLWDAHPWNQPPTVRKPRTQVKPHGGELRAHQQPEPPALWAHLPLLDFRSCPEALAGWGRVKTQK